MLYAHDMPHCRINASHASYCVTTPVIINTSAACHRCHSAHPRLARGMVRLAPGVGYRTARDASPLASARVPAVLAMAVSCWTSRHSCCTASPDSPDGTRESHLGP